MKMLVCAASKYGATSEIAQAVADVLAGRGAIPASAARVAADSQPPAAARLLHIAGLGGCEIDMHIALSADESDPASAVQYVVSANGAARETVHPDTRGSAPGFGTLDVFASPAGGRQTFTVAGVDSDGNGSALATRCRARSPRPAEARFDGHHRQASGR
jgi:hypothetical protein